MGQPPPLSMQSTSLQGLWHCVEMGSKHEASGGHRVTWSCFSIGEAFPEEARWLWSKGRTSLSESQYIARLYQGACHCLMQRTQGRGRARRIWRRPPAGPAWPPAQPAAYSFCTGYAPGPPQPPGPSRAWMQELVYTPQPVRTWLILSVVICLSQRLSHARVSTGLSSQFITYCINSA